MDQRKNTSSKYRKVKKRETLYGVKKNRPRSRTMIKSLAKKNRLKLREYNNECESDKINNERGSDRGSRDQRKEENNDN